MMTINDIYNLAIKMGKEADFRGKKEIKDYLKREKEKYNKLSDEKKKEFDKERLENPYADTRILYGDPDKEVKKILCGVDMDSAEVLLADKLGDIDLILAHHPRGEALAGLDEVMDLQVDILASYGVPVNVAEGLLKKKIKEVSRSVSSANHQQPVDVARLLGIPYMCSHTACDNLVASYVKEKIGKKEHKYVKDVLKTLKEIPEYKKAIQMKAGPALFSGSKDRRAGKIAITEITGGTEGAPEIYERLAQAGIGTVIGMHMSEEHTKKAKKAHVNAVIAGHMASDSLGVNLLLDELEKRDIEIIPVSGLIRVSRNKNLKK